MEELNLTQGHTYLLRYGCTDTLSQVTVLTITEKAYQVKWISGNIAWESKRRMDSDYSLVEDITDFPIYQEPIKLRFSTKYVTCSICGGMGNVPDFNSTAGTKLCPLCQGSKTIPEVTEVQS